MELRILHATAGVHGYNGVMSAVRELSLVQASEGHKPIVLARSGPGYTWPGAAYPCGLRVFDSCLSPAAAAVARRLAKTVDVVHVHVSKPPSEAMLAALQDHGVIATIHAVPEKPGAEGLLASAYRAAMSILLSLPGVRFIAVPSPPVASHPMLRRARGKVVIVPWGADSPYPKAPPPPRGARLRVAYVGRLSPEKGFHVLARSLPLIRGPIEVHIYGSGPLERLATRAAKAARVPVVLHGWRPKSEILAALSRGEVNVVVSPSLSETYSLAVAEAAWLHVPVLASRIPVHEWLLGRGYPGLFEPGDHAELADAINGLPWSVSILREAVEALSGRLPTWRDTHRLYMRLYRGSREG